MSKLKEIGVWMDYHHAKFIEDGSEIKIIPSTHNKYPREDGKGADGTRWGVNSSNNEHTKNQKEQNQLHEYYHQLMDILEDYHSILLFGPTKAKNELYNLIKENKNFFEKKVTVESADQLTDGELIKFVKEKLK